MRLLKFGFGIWLMILSITGAAAESSAGLTGDRPEYKSYLLHQIDAMRAKSFHKSDAFLKDSEHIHVAALMAAAEVRAWQWTGEERYAQSAIERLRLIAAKVDEIREADFFTPYPLTFACQGLSAGHRLDDRLGAALEKFAAKRFAPRDTTLLFNQTMIRACGLELAAQFWPNLKQSAGWHDYAKTITGLLEKIEDIPENAPNYNTFDLVCPFILTDLMKKPELMAKPGIRAMYQRYRDQVSPVGWIPPYGDSGGASNPLDPNWPMTSPWAHYVAAFERAAREYHDPTLRWAAVRLAQTGSRFQPLDGGYADIESIFYMTFVVEWAEPTVPPQRPELASAILTRRDFESDKALDKLILAPSRQPGVPFLMCDLYARGPHGHVNQHGSINYFECGDQPLLTILGYNSRDPEHTNLVMLRPAGDPFPHVPGLFVPGEWHEASLPTARLPVFDPEQPHLRRIESLNLRITGGRQGVTCWADDMRIQTSSGKPPMILDDFESPKGWGGNPVLCEDATEGKSSLKWNVPSGTHFLAKNRLNFIFDCREYSTLRFKWKLSNNDERSRPIILRIQGGGANVDFHCQAIQLLPQLTDAKVEQRGQDQYGLMSYTGWFTPDSTLRRQMVLTQSGLLVVRDSLLPGESARGMAAGPIWHLGPITEPQAGPNWFNSTGGKLDLFTWFEPAAGRTFGFQTVNVWSKENQRTLFARQLLEPGKPVCFVTVLVPHPPGQSAADLAGQISVKQLNSASEIRFASPTAPVRVTIDDNGAWQVGRSE